MRLNIGGDSSELSLEVGQSEVVGVYSRLLNRHTGACSASPVGAG